MKRFASLFMISFLIIAMLLVGCTQSAEPETAGEVTETEGSSAVDFPGDNTIEFWVGAPAGSAQDMWCRLLADEMGKYLDTSFVVLNKPGAAGFISFNEFMTTKPDGYSLISITSSMAGTRLNPSAPQEISVDDFDLLGSMIDDPGSLFIRADETRFTDFESLIEYAKENELTASVTGAGSDDDIPLYYLNEKYGTKFTPIVTSGGTAQSLSDLMGGHVDLISNNMGPFVNAYNEGQLIPMVIYGDKRYDLAPDIQTLKEITGDTFVIGNTRGVGMTKGTPEEIANILQEAFDYALQQDSLKEGYTSLGMIVNKRDADDFYQKFIETDQYINDFRDVMGW